MLSKFRLAAKFNLVFLLVFIASIASAGAIFNNLLQSQARQVVADQARLMMSNALAIRSYTTKDIKPVLSFEKNGKFIPQTVPAYSAKQAFSYLKENYPDFLYREAALNPTAPADMASDWEATIINRFRKEANTKEIIGVRNTPKGEYFYMARPLKVTAQNCLSCHSTPQVAPATMLAEYGRKNGFGWKLHETIGAQVVSVPVKVPQAIARRITILMMGALAAVLLLTLVILNVMLQFIVISPVQKLAGVADEISKGNVDVGELPVIGNDEIATLSGSFNRMIRSLRQAIRMLDGS